MWEDRKWDPRTLLNDVAEIFYFIFLYEDLTFSSEIQTIHKHMDLFTDGWLLKHILLLIILTHLVVKVGPSKSHKIHSTFIVLLLVLQNENMYLICGNQCMCFIAN